jgi:lysophospholipase L1-like esterase
MHRFGARREFTDREFGLALRAQAGWGITRLLWRQGIYLSAAPASQTGAPRQRVPLADYRENLAAFAAQTRAHGATPVILAWPFQNQVRGGPPVDELEAEARRYQLVARESASASGVLFLDLTAALARRDALFVDVVHLNGEGYGVVADAVATALAPLLPPATRAAR